MNSIDLVFIGEHRVRPTDVGLIESLRQRGYEVSFQGDPGSQQREPGLAGASAGQQGKDE